MQLAEGLGVSWGHVFAVELNASRAARIAEAYPDVRLFGPCSFEATRITRHSFSIVYLNPPFDDEFGGGGREEVQGSFVRLSTSSRARRHPRAGLPGQSGLRRRPPCASFSTPGLTRLELYLFPDNCRSFRECVMLGHRRKTALTDELIYREGILTSRHIRRRTAVPIASLARLGDSSRSTATSMTARAKAPRARGHLRCRRQVTNERAKTPGTPKSSRLGPSQVRGWPQQ